jgi:hypothetical protein
MDSRIRIRHQEEAGSQIRWNTGQPASSGLGQMNDREFRHQVAAVRVDFAEAYRKEPERTLEIFSELLREAIRLDADHYFGLTDSARPAPPRHHDATRQEECE